MVVGQPPRESTGIPTWYPGASRQPKLAVNRYDGKLGKTPPRAYNELLEPHSDGYAYGDAYPDHIVLLCAQDCETGGETFLVDGLQVLAALEQSPEHSWVPEALATRPINQGEARRRAAMSTVVQTAPSGRKMLRCMVWVQRPGGRGTEQDQLKDAEMLTAFHTAVMAAPRAHVKLKPGEALVFDNCACQSALHCRRSAALGIQWRLRAGVQTAASTAGIPLGTVQSRANCGDSGCGQRTLKQCLCTMVLSAPRLARRGN